MRILWATLNARSRGLACHLLAPDALQRLSSLADLQALSVELARNGYEPLWREASGLAEALDASVNARLAARIAKLWRWADDAADALLALFAEETRDALRALVRGCSAGSAPTLRHAAAVATPALDAERMARLASARTLRDLVVLVDELAPDWSDALEPARAAVQPDLLQLELNLSAALGRLQNAGARRTDAGFHELIADRVDHENAVSAWLLASSTAHDTDAAACFMQGGRRLSLSAYERAATATPQRSHEILIHTLAGAPAGKALEATPGRESMSERFLLACIAKQTVCARRDPLSSAPTILFILRARHEAVRVRRAVWSAALAGGASLAHEREARQ